MCIKSKQATPNLFKRFTLPTIQIARLFISFSWLYHGIFPKLIHIAPLEKTMTASLGLSIELSYWLTKTAGIAEILFGLLFLCFYKTKSLVWLNIAALTGLLIFVAIFQPHILIEAFNPVTTNVGLICLSFILLNEINAKDNNVST
ncbi:DoxX-like family protein [Thalassotalea fusca]